MFDWMPLTLGQEALTPAPSTPVTLQATPTSTAQPAAGATTKPTSSSQMPSIGGLLVPMLLMLGLMFFFTSRSQRKEKKKRESMLAQMSKGAKVQTIGGIKGTIVEIRDDEVVVKVDENANTRIKFTRGSIQTVLTDDDV